MQKKLYLILMSIILSGSLAFGQMPHDAIYMPKNTACLAMVYGHNSWNQYWENTLKRDNLNMGTFKSQMIMPMLALGISDKLNIIVGVPYISTKTTTGNLMGQKGLQDFSAWVKYKLAEKNGFAIHGAIGASLPTTNYVAEFLPMSIGMKSKTLIARFITSYYHKSGMYFTGSASYVLRGVVKIDKDGYQAFDKIYNTDLVEIPNASDARAAIGYSKKGLITEVFVDRFTCIGGDNIRRNDMPFLTNNMQSTSIGYYAKYQPKNLGANARIAYVTNGLNVGQTFSYSIGVMYQFNSLKLGKNLIIPKHN